MKKILLTAFIACGTIVGAYAGYYGHRPAPPKPHHVKPAPQQPHHTKPVLPPQKPGRR